MEKYIKKINYLLYDRIVELSQNKIKEDENYLSKLLISISQYNAHIDFFKNFKRETKNGILDALLKHLAKFIKNNDIDIKKSVIFNSYYADNVKYGIEVVFSGIFMWHYEGLDMAPTWEIGKPHPYTDTFTDDLLQSCDRDMTEYFQKSNPKEDNMTNLIYSIHTAPLKLVNGRFDFLECIRASIIKKKVKLDKGMIDKKRNYKKINIAVKERIIKKY